MNVQTINKAAIAQAIFAEEAAKGDDKLCARVIARFKAELSMGAPGASTYFQNCKKKAAGQKVKHYYKRRTAALKAVAEAVLLLTHQPKERWVAVQGEVEIGFKTRTQAQEFAKVNEAKVVDMKKAA